MMMDWKNELDTEEIHAGLSVEGEIKSWHFKDKIMECNHIPLCATKKWAGLTTWNAEREVVMSFYSVTGKHYLTLLMLIIYLN